MCTNMTKIVTVGIGLRMSWAWDTYLCLSFHLLGKVKPDLRGTFVRGATDMSSMGPGQGTTLSFYQKDLGSIKKDKPEDQDQTPQSSSEDMTRQCFGWPLYAGGAGYSAGSCQQNFPNPRPRFSEAGIQFDAPTEAVNVHSVLTLPPYYGLVKLLRVI